MTLSFRSVGCDIIAARHGKTKKNKNTRTMKNNAYHEPCMPRRMLADNETLLRREAQHLLAAEVGRLLASPDASPRCWTGSQADLMEALYLAFETGDLTDDMGLPITFTSLVRKVFARLGRSVPGNPYKVARIASARKGIRQQCYLNRYLLLYKRGHHDIFLKHIN